MEELAGNRSTGDELIIALSKGRLSLIALGAIAFVVLCAWVVTADDVSIVRRALAGIGIPFFGLCALWGLRKLFDTRPAATDLSTMPAPSPRDSSHGPM